MNTWNGKQLPERFVVHGPTDLGCQIRYGLLDVNAMDWAAFWDKQPGKNKKWVYNPNLEIRIDPLDTEHITALSIFQEPPND